MKRYVMLVLMLILSLSVVCQAAETPLSLSNGKGDAGQVVYLTLTLNEPVTASTVGVKCEFDDTLLTALPELCSWERAGLLSAFEADNMGAWTVASGVKLEGKLCVLAFQVKQGVAFTETEVTCTVVLKDGAKEIGTYTAEGRITGQCTHSYGDWTSAGEAGHERLCSLCGGRNTQAHDWDDGTQKPGEGNVTVITYTCLDCLEQKTQEIPTGGEHTDTTEPVQTEPDGIIVIPAVPDQDPQVPTDPGQNGQTGQNGQEEQDHSHSTQDGSQNGQEEQDHSHSTQGGSQTGDTVIPDHTHAAGEETLASDHGHSDTAQTEAHDHVHTTAGGSSEINGWVILGVLVLAVGGGMAFLKKKR